MTQLSRLLSIWVILISIFNTPYHSQIKAPQPKFVHYGIEKGLPSSETYFVYQDKKGYMWFCTDRGVVRFDGYRYKTYTTNDGLLNDVVFKVYEDFKGRIWFLSMSNELCYLENNKIKKYKFNYLINKHFGKTSQTSKNIVITKNENIYITIKFYGTIKITKKGQIEIIDKYEGNKISFFNINSEIINSQVYQIPSAKKIVEIPLKFNNKINNTGWDKQETYGFFFKNSFYYVLNGEIYNNKNQQVSHFNEHNRILNVLSTKNEIYFGTLNNGLKIINLMNNEFIETKKFLKQYSITSIILDREKNTWISTLENGVFLIKNQFILNLNSKNGLIENFVNSISGFSQNIYAGYNSGKWQNLNVNTEFNKQIKTRNKTKLICYDSSVYISSDHLYRLKDGQIKTILLGQWTRSLTVSNDEILITTTNVSSLNKKNQTNVLYIPFFDNTPNKESKFEAVLRDQNGTILLGNENGLHKLKNKQINHASLTNKLFKSRITDLKFNTNFNNIAATRGKGIYFFKENDIIDSLKIENGLLSNDINSIYIDSKDRLWVCSNKGLNLIIKQINGYLIEQFTAKNGLISNEINEVYEYKNKIWCATKKGISIIDLNLFRRSFVKKPILLEKVITKNKTIIESSFNIFPYDEEFVKVLFRSLNYKNNQNPTFAYRTSKNSDWQYIKTPELIFNFPSSNTYNIEVKSLNEDGKWSKPQLIYSFIIDVPFYYKWYSLLAFTLIIIGIMYLIFRIRINQINQKNNLNKKIKQLESKALRAQMNPHFIFNALNSIQSFLVYEENEKAEKYLIKFAYLIRQTLNNSRKSIVSIENEIDILNKYLELEEMRFKNRFTFNIENNLNETDINLKIPPMMIQPYVENAILHAFKNINSGGLIHVIFQKIEKDKLTCIIEDNGIGISNSLKVKVGSHVSLGTTITAERLSFFSRKKSNQFKIETFEKTKWGDQGTKIVIEIPTFKSDEEL